MDLPSLLNTKGSAVRADHHLHHHQSPLGDAQARLSAGPDRGLSPLHHMADHSTSKFSSARPDHHRLHLTTNMTPTGHFAESPHVLQQFGMVTNPYPTPTTSYDTEYSSIATDDGRSRGPTSATSEPTPVKAFACSTCGKGFARRSDLARHERIHTGVRPHVCEYPGCKKQFIQRSALTVHARVHTGEKPHMCEHCTKPFSDSSSLARHRRIHSGKRPYKCPYSDCQKTFTRRTTLTRHMSHHTGTVEESAAATAAARAQRPLGSTIARPRSDGDVYSDAGGSARSTPSPGRRIMSTSPSNELPHVSLLPRHNTGDFSFMTGAHSGRSLPPHIRGDLQQPSPRSSTGSSSPSSTSFGPTNPLQHQRPSLTSHPAAMYGPPPILEPPTNHEQRSSGSNSGSPHLGSVGWQSPANIGSPAPHDNFNMYGDASGFGGHASHWGYAAAAPHMRRPQSTEPDHYETKSRMVPHEVWTAGM